MKSQTERRPDTKRPARSAQTRKYTKQTAHVSARRDGKPLIFGWGGHLSRHEKTRIQNRAVWSLIVLIALLIIGVVAGFWIDNYVVIPNQPITSVNGQGIPQSDYHKLVALKAQIEANKIQGRNGLNAQSSALSTKITNEQNIVNAANTQITQLNKEIKALPAGSSTQRTNLEQQLTAAQTKQSAAQKLHDTYQTQYQTLQSTTIPNENVFYTQDQIGTESATWLQDDIIIRNWLAKQSSNLQTSIQPSTATINSAINEFKANLPTNTSYSKFLSNDNVSDSDVHTMMAVILRRDNMQNYLYTLVTSPALQYRVRSITLSTQSDANNILKQLKANNSANFAALAKSKSVDSNTKASGGEIGWLAYGQYTREISQDVADSGVIDNWLFNTSHKVGDLSPVLLENGTYHILQIEQVDPSHAITAQILSDLRGTTTNNSVVGNYAHAYALTNWLLMQRALPGVTITTPDSTMLTSTTNMPQSVPTSSSATPTVTTSTTG